VTKVRLNLAGERIGPQLAKISVKNKAKVLAAARGAAEDTVEYVEQQANADIAGAGKFGARWHLTGSKTEGGGFIKLTFTMPSGPPMKYWRVFEFGATIHGKPMLWIPLSFASDAKGIYARDYPGKLFRVNRKAGALLLATGKPFAPKYFGKASVTIPKKFHLHEIIKDGSKQLKLFYSERIKANG
jgi:hypothetical protein